MVICTVGILPVLIIFFQNSAETVAQLGGGIGGKIQKHLSATAIPTRATISAEFRQNFIRNRRNKLRSVLFVISC